MNGENCILKHNISTEFFVCSAARRKQRSNIAICYLVQQQCLECWCDLRFFLTASNNGALLAVKKI